MSYGAWLDFQFPYPASTIARLMTYQEMVNNHKDNLTEMYTRDWYLPLRLRLIELDINKLINQIFQERPSLP